MVFPWLRDVWISLAFQELYDRNCYNTSIVIYLMWQKIALCLHGYLIRIYSIYVAGIVSKAKMFYWRFFCHGFVTRVVNGYMFFNWYITGIIITFPWLRDGVVSVLPWLRVDEDERAGGWDTAEAAGQTQDLWEVPVSHWPLSETFPYVVLSVHTLDWCKEK